jgi:hypothetical protein
MYIYTFIYIYIYIYIYMAETGGQTVEDVQGRVEFRDVSFDYPCARARMQMEQQARFLVLVYRYLVLVYRY